MKLPLRIAFLRLFIRLQTSSLTQREGERKREFRLLHISANCLAPLLGAIINLRFIFIGKLESRLALTKQNRSYAVALLEWRRIFL